MKENSERKSLNARRREFIRPLMRPLLPFQTYLFSVHLAYTASSIAAAFLIRNLTDGVISGAASVSLILWTAAAVLSYCVSIYYVNFLNGIAQSKGSVRVKKYLLRKIISFPQISKGYACGEVSQIVAGDGRELGGNASTRWVVGASGIIGLAAYAAVLFYTSWLVGLVIIIVFPLSALVAAFFDTKAAGHNKRISVVAGEEIQLVSTGAAHAAAIGRMGKIDYYADKQAKLLRKRFLLIKKFHRASQVSNTFSSTITLVLPLLVGVVAAGATAATSGGSAQFGSVLFVIAITGNILAPFQTLLGFLRSVYNDNKLYEKICGIVEYFPARAGSLEIDDINEVSVKLKNFAYEDDDKVLFGDFSLRFKKGGRVAVTGESGAGKSTLLKLLAKETELPPSRGEILINGIDINDISEESYFKRIRYVRQTDFLLTASLKENLCMGDEFTDAEIEDVLKTCCLADFAAEYGLDMEIDEHSANLSGGQLQRICLARALIRNPSLLLLDEPMSALDEETSAELARNLDAYLTKRGAAMLAVTHKEYIPDISDTVIDLR